MSKDDLVNIDGRVTDIKGGGTYVVTLDNGVVVMAKLSGKMKKFSIRVVTGDRVQVAFSPYDISHGLIMFRHKV